MTVDADGDAPIAYAQASRANSSWTIELVVAPAHRGDLYAIGRDLIGAALDVIGADGGGRVDWWVFEPDAGPRRARRHDRAAAGTRV